MHEAQWSGYMLSRAEMLTLLQIAGCSRQRWQGAGVVGQEEARNVCAELCRRGLLISDGSRLMLPGVLQEMILTLTESSRRITAWNHRSALAAAHAGRYWVMALQGRNRVWRLQPLQRMQDVTAELRRLSGMDLAGAQVALQLDGQVWQSRLDDAWHEQLTAVWNRLCRQMSGTADPDGGREGGVG
ncbi:MAG: hypothetical protein IJ343_01035 [Clostridia bacterium]|nr:hypothetical protein [Clostridia bacterium]